MPDKPEVGVVIDSAPAIVREPDALAVLVVPLREFVTVTEYVPAWFTDPGVKLYWLDVACEIGEPPKLH
jgi:hypothetical protein